MCFAKIYSQINNMMWIDVVLNCSLFCWFKWPSEKVCSYNSAGFSFDETPDVTPLWKLRAANVSLPKYT